MANDITAFRITDTGARVRYQSGFASLDHVEAYLGSVAMHDGATMIFERDPEHERCADVLLFYVDRAEQFSVQPVDFTLNLAR